jgi:WD40 repeat protein
VDGLAFAADGMRLAVASDAPAVQVFAAGGSNVLADLKLEGGPVRAIRFSPDGRALLLAPREGVVLWEPETHKAVRFIPYGGEPRDVVFTPDGAGMIVADKRGQLLFGKPAESAPAPSQTVAVATQVLTLAIAPNGLLATGEGDRAVTVRGPNGKQIQRYREPDAAVRAVAFLPQGLVAASFYDGAIRIFRGNGPGAVGVLRPMPGMKPGALAGVVEAPSGHLELVGPDAAAARAGVRCRLGASLYPFEVCAEQLAMPGLLKLIVGGQDPAEAEP